MQQPHADYWVACGSVDAGKCQKKGLSRLPWWSPCLSGCLAILCKSQPCRETPLNGHPILLTRTGFDVFISFLTFANRQNGLISMHRNCILVFSRVRSFLV